MKKQEFKNMRRGLGTLKDNFKHSKSWIIGVPEGEEEEQEVENLFEKIMKENFLILVKEIDIWVQEAQRVPKKKHPNRATTKYIIIKMPKVKDKDRILKAAREKQRVTYKGVPIRLSADFSKETLQARKWLARSIQSDEKQGHYPAKLSFRREGQIKCFPDKVKLKEFIITKPLLYGMLKGLKKKKIKSMNIKMTTKPQLSTTESKKQKLSKQLEQE